MQDIQINQEQKLYVLGTPAGFSALGFDYCFDTTSQLALILNERAPEREQIGTMDLYRRYQDLIGTYSRRNDLNHRTWFDPRTPCEVARLLEEARTQGQRLRLFFGDTETGSCWLEENDVLGFIGRSMGPMRVPLLLRSRCSDSGGAILTACIVRILDAGTRREKWRHHQFRLPEMALAIGNQPGMPFEVHSEGQCVARFALEPQRNQWLAFMRGAVMTTSIR